MEKKKIPISFIICAILFVSLFAFFLGTLIYEILANSFLINPIYLLELSFGFLGLLIVSLVAIVEWKIKYNWKKRHQK